MTDPSLADLAATNTKVAHLMRSHGPNVFGQTVDAYTTMIERLEEAAAILRAAAQTPSQENLQQLFHYDYETGEFTWKTGTCRCRPLEGRPAGTVSREGYLRIGIKGYGPRMAHRLAWMYTYGEPVLPGYSVDHIDGNRLNNAIANLRLATRQQQNWNQGVSSASDSGIKGVFQRGGKWIAVIDAGGKRRALGHFDKAEDAHEAYQAAARSAYGEFAPAPHRCIRKTRRSRLGKVSAASQQVFAAMGLATA